MPTSKVKTPTDKTTHKTSRSPPLANDDKGCRRFLRDMFDAAIKVVDPATCLPPFLPKAPKGRVIVVGAGKGAASMAAVVEQHFPQCTGLVVCPPDHELPCQTIEILSAPHPVPDSLSERAARAMLKMVGEAKEDDIVLALISGGGSALMSLPAPGLSMADKQIVSKSLLVCGATIKEINTVRRHLSAIKGGRLAAAAYPARTQTFIISDIPGDDPTWVCSGPTMPNHTTPQDALDVLTKYTIDVPSAVLRRLEVGHADVVDPDDQRLTKNSCHVIATAQDALAAAAAYARDRGVTPVILTNALQGEASVAGQIIGSIAKQALTFGEPQSAPCVILSGGETTVTVRSDSGQGGRNTEFLGGLAIELDGKQRIYALACDTDGIDGRSGGAGAIITPDTALRARKAGTTLATALEKNDCGRLFHTLGDAIKTGPTLTNVNDFRAVYIAAP
ncbi:MAG: glycerate kinase [Pseudomonadota bacterium]